MKSNHPWGFTLIELLIVMCIIGILAALAIPSYRVYTRRAHYMEIIQAAAPFKLAVQECYAIKGDLPSCLGGQFGVPQNMGDTAEQSLVDHIKTTAGGIITITPKNKFGITSADTYVLTPIDSHHQLVWHGSGAGVDHGYAG